MPRQAFDGRGIVLNPRDFSLVAWPELAAEAGLNVVAFHITGGPPSVLTEFLRTEEGGAVRDRLVEVGLDVEYELHAMGALLPRSLYERNPELFRANEEGERVADCNLCPSNADALRTVAENAVSLSRELRPTTHRYYLWADDGAPWCKCGECHGLNDADQALITTNAILAALRQEDPEARVAALAYHATLEPPSQVRPDEGVFLEYAPIERQWDRPITDASVQSHAKLVEALDAVIHYYGVDEHSQVIEYWMDASRHSRWKRPSVKIPWHPDVLEVDLDFYASKGFCRVTSFGCYLDREYVGMYGLPPIAEYGAALSGLPTGGDV
jgi:hypothetical protein